MPQRQEDTKKHKKEFKPIPAETERIGKKIVNAAFAVHSQLGSYL